MLSIAVWQFGFSNESHQVTDTSGVSIKSTMSEIGGGSTVVFELQNKKSLAICIDGDDFDSMMARIYVYQNGKEVTFYGLAEPPRSRNSETNYAIPYYILMPGDDLTQYYHLDNFAIKKGPVRVKLLLPYYHCLDLVDAKGYRAKKEPQPYLMEHDSTLLIK